MTGWMRSPVRVSRMLIYCSTDPSRCPQDGSMCSKRQPDSGRRRSQALGPRARDTATGIFRRWRGRCGQVIAAGTPWRGQAHAVSPCARAVRVTGRWRWDRGRGSAPRAGQSPDPAITMPGLAPRCRSHRCSFRPPDRPRHDCKQAAYSACRNGQMSLDPEGNTEGPTPAQGRPCSLRSVLLKW